MCYYEDLCVELVILGAEEPHALQSRAIDLAFRDISLYAVHGAAQIRKEEWASDQVVGAAADRHIMDLFGQSVVTAKQKGSIIS